VVHTCRREALRFFAACLIACAIWAAGAGSASAQGGFGLHGGGTIDPDQGYFGMHFISGPLTGDLRLQPSADLGFGDDLILSALHVDFAQWLEVNPRWHLYFGGGPSVNIFRFDVPDAGGGGGDDSFTEVEGGFDAIVGFAHDSGLTVEMRVGSSGAPDLRFGVGLTFR
jgi:hypothetical protein